MIRYGFKPSGCFVVVDTEFPWWALAFDGSPLQREALKDPTATARKMLDTMRQRDLGVIRAMCGSRQHENREHWKTLQQYGVSELS